MYPCPICQPVKRTQLFSPNTVICMVLVQSSIFRHHFLGTNQYYVQHWIQTNDFTSYCEYIAQEGNCKDINNNLYYCDYTLTYKQYTTLNPGKTDFYSVNKMTIHDELESLLHIQNKQYKKQHKLVYNNIAQIIQNKTSQLSIS